MTAFPIGSRAVQPEPDSLGRADHAADAGNAAARHARRGDANEGTGALFTNDALLAIEHGDRLEEQADAIAEYLKSELESKDEAERLLREAEQHEWLDPEILAEFLAETLQQDEDAKRSRDALVSDLQQGLPQTMSQLLRERCGGNPTKLFVALQQAAGAMRRGAVAADDDEDDDHLEGRNGRGDAPRADGVDEDGGSALERLQDMVQELELTHGTRIRADLNTGGVWQMPETGRQLDAGEIAALQASYTTLVEGDTRIASVLHRVLDGVDGTQARHNEGGLVAPVVGMAAQAVLERFIQALGRDIDALRPSVEREHLHALLTEKSLMITAVTVLQQCDTLALALHPDAPGAAAPAALQTMRKAVELTDQSYFAPESFVSFARTMAAPTTADAPPKEGVDATLARAIPFLQGFSVVVRDMPERVFVDDAQRGRARDAVQHALDDLIDEENADG